MRRRCSRSAFPLIRVRSTSPIRTVPASASIRRITSRADRGFSRTGFADQTERLAAQNVEADFLCGLHAALGAEPAAAADIGLAEADHFHRLARSSRGVRCGGCRVGTAASKARAYRDAAGAQQHVVGRALFDHPAVLHHGDAIGDIGDDAEIMGDEQDRHAAAVLHVADQLQDLRLRRDVERGGRLVCHQHRPVRAPAPSRSWRAGAGRRRVDAGSCDDPLGVGQADFADQASALVPALRSA